jgi:hypothetical protein
MMLSSLSSSSSKMPGTGREAISEALSAILVTTVGPMVGGISDQQGTAGKLADREGEDGEAE